MTTLALPADYLATIHHVDRRPQTFDDLVGNEATKEILGEAIVAAQRSHTTVPHVLLAGPSGMGKTTIAEILARTIGGGIVKTTGSTLETPVDVLRLIDDLWAAGNADNARPVVVFLDEIHAVGGGGKSRQSIDIETLYTLLEDWRFMHNMEGKPYRWRDNECTPNSGVYHVYPFTLVGATTDPGLLPTAMLGRFPLQIEMVPYTDEEIAEILRRTADRQGWAITPDAVTYLSTHARKTPRTAQSLLTHCHTRAVAHDESITLDLARFVIARLRLHRLGLSETDISVLKVLRKRPRGVGAAEISRAVGIATSTFTEICEPYLRLLGLVETLQRRVLTEDGHRYLESIGV